MPLRAAWTWQPGSWTVCARPVCSRTASTSGVTPPLLRAPSLPQLIRGMACSRLEFRWMLMQGRSNLQPRCSQAQCGHLVVRHGCTVSTRVACVSCESLAASDVDGSSVLMCGLCSRVVASHGGGMLPNRCTQHGSPAHACVHPAWSCAGSETDLGPSVGFGWGVGRKK